MTVHHIYLFQILVCIIYKITHAEVVIISNGGYFYSMKQLQGTPACPLWVTLNTLVTFTCNVYMTVRPSKFSGTCTCTHFKPLDKGKEALLGLC